MKKLYCYVDETGQDTEGKLFVVVVIIVGNEKETLLEQIEEIERKSGKFKRKWTNTRKKERVLYLAALYKMDVLSQQISYLEVFNSIDYEDMIAYAIARAIEAYTKVFLIESYKSRQHCKNVVLEVTI